MRKVLLFSLIILCFFSCTKKSEYSLTPKISYIEMQPKQLNVIPASGSTYITLSFSDGDGDIGFGTNNLYLKDSRDSTTIVMEIPEIPGEYNPNLGLKGQFVIEYKAAWLSLRPDTAHLTKDTLQWEIYMVDKAGNKSNTINTDTLFLFK